VNRFASWGRWRASARNVRAWFPRSSTLSVPLRSWRSMLNPADAPKPEIVGMLNGKTTASGISANRGVRCAMIPFTWSAGSWRSSQSLSRIRIVPKFGWYVFVTSPNPPMVV
jgi:hypothetical protein